MSEERSRVLTMLAEGKITVAEAEQLLNAIGAGGGHAEARPDAWGSAPGAKGKPRYLRVVVNGEGGGDKVNIRVPLQLFRAGIKLSALLPEQAKEKMGPALRDKGIDLDLRHAKPEDIEELIDALTELTVDVNDEKEQVRIYCE